MNDVIELGGFAENKEDIDGTEEDFNAFNFCLAEDYVTALYNENFEEVGEVSYDLFENILDWYNYTPELNNEDKAKTLKNGTFETYRKRPLIDAILEKRYASLAFTYLGLGFRVYSPKLILAIILAKEDYPACIPCENEQDLETKLLELYELIEEEYNAAIDKKRVFNNC